MMSVSIASCVFVAGSSPGHWVVSVVAVIGRPAAFAWKTDAWAATVPTASVLTATAIMLAARRLRLTFILPPGFGTADDGPVAQGLTGSNTSVPATPRATRLPPTAMTGPTARPSHGVLDECPSVDRDDRAGDERGCR